MTAGRVRVLVVDAHPITVVGLRCVLQSSPDIELVETCGTGADALAALARARPSLVILDATLPDMPGAELCRTLKDRAPEIDVLFLTACEDNATVFGAVSAGASGYILKDITPDNLLRAIFAVRRGQTMLHPGVARRMLDKLSLITRNGNGGLAFDGKLTAREAEILVEVARGLTNKEIALKLFISESTVKSRLRGVFGKINAHDRAQAAVYAIRGGYVR